MPRVLLFVVLALASGPVVAEAIEVTPRVDRPASAGAGQTWAMYLSSSGGPEIRNCRTWRHGWKQFVEKRALPAVERHGAVWVHNPGGVVSGQAMKFQQFTECEQQASLSGDEQLSAISDWTEFSEQMSRVSAEGPLVIYIGCPSTMKPKPGETDQQWLDRALAEIEPILRIEPKPIIGFDATYGHPAADPPWDRLGGEAGLIARLLYRLSADGYELLVEPAILRRAEWLNDIAGVCATEFWWHKMLLGGQDRRVPHYKPEWGDHLRPTEVTGRQVRIYTELYKKPLDEQQETLRATVAAGYDAAIYGGDLDKIDQWQAEEQRDESTAE